MLCNYLVYFKYEVVNCGHGNKKLNRQLWASIVHQDDHSLILTILHLNAYSFVKFNELVVKRRNIVYSLLLLEKHRAAK